MQLVPGTITGTNFVSVLPTVEAIKSTGAITTRANSVRITSATSISANLTLTVDLHGTYFIRVENNDGLAVRFNLTN